MIIIPAIDLKDGLCVRLRQGVMSESSVFSHRPIDMADKWIKMGARRLHLVDLNAAFAGKPINTKSITKIVKTYPDVLMQVGGGIRNLDNAKRYIDLGVAYLIIGTQAVKNPDFVEHLCQLFPGQIIVGLDGKNNFATTEGWINKTDITLTKLVKKFQSIGVVSIIYTDIKRDGMMEGVNITTTSQLAKSSDIPIIASGGVKDIDDIKALLVVAHYGISAVITGRAIYEGTLDFALAQQLADEYLQNKSMVRENLINKNTEK